MARLKREELRNPISQYYFEINGVGEVTKIKFIDMKMWSEESVLIRTGMGEFILSFRKMRSKILVTLRDMNLKEINSKEIENTMDIVIVTKSMRYNNREVVMFYSLDDGHSFLVDVFSLDISELEDLTIPIENDSFALFNLEEETISLISNKFGVHKERSVSFKDMQISKLQNFVKIALKCMIDEVEINFIK